MEPILILSLLLSFFITLFFTHFWIRKMGRIGLVWEDMHKKDHPKNVAGSGGIGVFFGFSIGILTYIAIKTFYFQTTVNITYTFVIFSSIAIMTLIGFIDDLLGWRRGGLSIRSRILLIIFASIPLMVINAGDSEMVGIELGLLYPLVIIPLGIVGASTTFNFLAGYNGLEASQGILILSSLSLVVFFTGNAWISIIGLSMVASLLAFYIFNKFPAKIFPGDSLTYMVGGLIAIMAILGDVEKVAIFFFIPYIIETILKVKGGLKKESFGKLNKEGSLEVPYEKIYGLEHLAIKILKKVKPSGKVYEKDVVFIINTFQILIILLGFVLFRKTIFV